MAYRDHMDVAIRELKAKLSSYVQRAAAGEHITVTDRGRPVAMLGPPIGRVDLDAAAEAGWLTLATAPGGLKPVRRQQAVRPVLEVLEEDRAE
jgi:prevent-host-death family protein